MATEDKFPKLEQTYRNDTFYDVIRKVPVLVNYADNSASIAVKIVKECLDYDGEIFFESDSCSASCRNVAALMNMDLVPGTSLDILVERREGRAEEAEKKALRLFSGMTTPGDEPNWSRLERVIELEKLQISYGDGKPIVHPNCDSLRPRK